MSESESSSVFRRVFTVDLRSLAAFRMCLASLLLVDLFFRFRHLRDLFTDEGYLNRNGIVEAFGNSVRWTSLHFHTASSVTLQGLMLATAGLFAIALLVGYRTWVATFASWVLLVSVNRRIPAICYGFDEVSRLMLFWCLFLPWGARWSLDGRRHLAHGKERPSDQFFSAATVGILLQVCYIYLFTIIWKIHPDWLSGQAMKYALELNYSVRPLGRWVGTKPWLTVSGTYTALLIELLAPCAALSPWRNDWGRWIAILSMWILHGGIWCCMAIGLFPPVSMAYWVLFIPSSTWDFLQKRFGGDRVPKDAPSLSAPWTRTWVNLIAVLLILQITAYNILGLPQIGRRGIGHPVWFQRLSQLMRIDQQWSMYAPSPRGPDGWFVMPAILADGSSFDVWQNRPTSYDRPANVPATFRGIRTSHLLMKSRKVKFSPVWKHVADYVIREWNTTHPESRSIQKMQIVFVRVHEGNTYVEFYFDSAPKMSVQRVD